MNQEITITPMTDDEGRAFYRIYKPNGEISLDDLEEVLSTEGCPIPKRVTLEIGEVSERGDRADVYLQENVG